MSTASQGGTNGAADTGPFGGVSQSANATSLAMLSIRISKFPTAQPTGPAYGTEEIKPWPEWLAEMQGRRIGTKDGRGFVPASFKPDEQGRIRRVGINLVSRTAVVLDVETDKTTGEIPPSADEAAIRLERNGWGGIIYTSHSHTSTAPRFRVVIPLSAEIAVDLPAVQVIADLLGLYGTLDRGKIGAASMFYLPSAASDHDLPRHQTIVIPGPPIDAAWMQQRAGTVLAAQEADRERMRTEVLEEAAGRRAARARQGYDPNESIIEAVRARLDIERELVAHGYRRVHERQYLFAGSQSGIAGVHVMVGSDGVARVYSHHSADPLATGNLPTWCGVRAVDVVDLIIILDHGGDRKKGLRSLAMRFGISTPRPQAHRPHANGKDGEAAGGPSTAGDGNSHNGAYTNGYDEASQQYSDTAQRRAPNDDTFAWPEPLDFLADPGTEAPELRHDHIPAALNDFVFDVAGRMGVDPTSVALGGITSCASVVSDDWKVQPKSLDNEWTESARLWALILGPPATLKSPVITACTRPIDQLDEAARKRHAEAMRAYKQELKAAKSDPSGQTQEPRYPKLDRYLVEGATVEALTEVLRDDDDAHQRPPAGKVLSRQDEMSEFVANFDRYRSGGSGGGDRGAYLRSYNGGRYIVDRIGRGSFAVPNWSMCLIGGIQPGPIQKIAKGAAEDGLLQRPFYCVPGPQVPGVDRKPSAEARRRYQNLFPALAALHPPRTQDGEHVQVVVFHKDAHQHRGR